MSMLIIPESLWLGEERHEELLKEWFEKDDFIGDESEEKLIARMVKELKDEPLVLEYLEIY